MKRTTLVQATFFLSLFLIASCFPVRAIKLNIQTKALEIIVGETKNIALTVDPVDSTVSFTTADDSIATVSPLGVVTGVAVGKTTVAIEATKDGYKKAQGAVTINVVPVIPEYTVTFEVSDLEGPVNGADVAFNSETKLTDANGQAIFSGVLGVNRQYTVSKIGYEDATGTVNVDGDKTVDVTLSRKLYTLSIEVTGEGTVTKNLDKPEYTHGEEVQLTAIPDAGWSFTNWTGDLTGSDNPKAIVMDQNRSVTATFTRNQYTVNLFAEPQEGGTAAGGGVYFYGDEATITAQASDCYLFTGWYEDGLLVSESAEYSFTVDGERELEARFAKAVISKEFIFIEEYFILGRLYKVSIQLDLRISYVRFVYPGIDPNTLIPIPGEATPDASGRIEMEAFLTTSNATAVEILCYSGDNLLSQCLAKLDR